MTSKQAAKRFSRLLDELWQRRTGALRRLVPGAAKGKRKKFTKKKKDQLVRKMLDAAHQVLVQRYARKELKKAAGKSRRKRIKGFGIQDRYKRMREWADSKLRGPIVYSFWRGKKCLYVGKGKSPRRLRSYKKSIYLKEASLLRVWEVGAQKRLPKVECLAVHLFKPRDNLIGPARKKWAQKCPVCHSLRKIKKDLKHLFSMKSGKKKKKGG